MVHVSRIPRFAAAFGVLMVCGAAVAQNSPAAQQPRNSTPVRKPVISLDSQAKERRPGQIMPGDPAPSSGVPAQSPEPLPQASPKPTPAAPPPSAASTSGSAVKPAIVKPDAGPRVVPSGALDIFAPLQPVRMDAASVKLGVVSGDAGGVQWRASQGAWASASADQPASGHVEIRTTLGVGATFTVDDQFELVVGSLSHVLVERAVTSDDKSEVMISLERGTAFVRPLKPDGGLAVRVSTPDRDEATRAGVGAEYNAFTGTRFFASP